ncbi:hypothetical protein BDP55DRAFT_631709 [Colletotrichum godetiae]|uniref:Uncharacterized protein n=1 Tax=Colletotrichum godetiae TaxID=1209918 RepID=A0AAJ0EY99_9PEZI|nr:uncharacterized protein BDP55DRAFT_631709 [Colletotrichum godetiae]KAK1676015.1 hypothetical protein BDP55DRAFT_631709 [Colletotrichum godetiae]
MIELREADFRDLAATLCSLPEASVVARYGRLPTNTPCSQSAYLGYCYRQWGVIAGYNDGLYIAFKEPGELKALILYLSSADTITKDDLSIYFGDNDGKRPNYKAQETTINLALRLLLMLKFGPVQGEAFPHHHLVWTSGCLKDCIVEYLDEGPRLDVKGVRLPKTFHAWSLVAIGGIQIEFTDNLADHLLLIEEENGMKVVVFHHVAFLRCHRRQVDSSGV